MTIKPRTKLSNSESFLRDSLVKAYSILLTKRGNNNYNWLKDAHELLSLSEGIFSNRTTSETFAYFCINRAATAWILQNELGIPESTIYRALKQLRALKIIVPALKAQKSRREKGGPRPVVWSLEDAGQEYVARALRQHIKLLSPKFRVAQEIAQTILDEYIVPREVDEISYREIVIKVK
jgi:DNA-binding PadR family transcriptional regulator